MNGMPFSRYSGIYSVAVLLASILGAAGCSHSPTLEISRRFQDAEEQFTVASSPKDFVKVAALYQEILDEGFESGVIFYNQGNAWMQAGNVGHAIAAYRQAKRLLPRDPYLDANLNQAIALTGATSHRKPLANYLFFWQSWLSSAEKSLLTTTLLAIALALLLFSQHRQSRSLQRTGFAVLIVAAFSGASLARDWHNHDLTTHGVVVTEDSTARKGASESFESAFNQSLARGTEFIVVDKKDNWLQVEITGVGRGWIPQRATVIY